ncbi:YdeI/OmpD-associated family protein [Mucilaginibacter sp.]|uniref:YdeI/OmpD-associated family protein n=1 Tax=Mucilaginibacter sp. TaxID=1882438 RepID=UPI000CB23D97|nr:YdeI/OmpD-associated family protein [Mucilaginibacter sp.]PLW90160.1 MAG: hypothetical protein C0154_07830 [Mucilaginibacter sp.]HEK21400.1 hypothetical protein [Bacteroidota bacterium]
MISTSALAKKLQMKAGQTWLLISPPEDYAAALDPLPDGVELFFTPDRQVSGVQAFAKTQSELTAILLQLKPILNDDTILWVIYPKKNSGIATDLEMMSSWDEPAKYQLRPVASAAINDTWTALRFKPEHMVKRSDTSQEAMKQQNTYSDYIDPVKKQITLPSYLQEALAGAPAAFVNFEKLAWSHRKEYVVWILSAKQEQTRANRITKMVEMLLTGKKNPADK